MLPVRFVPLPAGTDARCRADRLRAIGAATLRQRAPCLKTPHNPDAAARTWCAVSLVSAAALAYEILLTRLFAIIQWHHFAYMIISVALLGYGAAGTMVTLFRPRLEQRLAPCLHPRRRRSALPRWGVSWWPRRCLQRAGIPLGPLAAPVAAGDVYAVVRAVFFAAACVCLAFTRYAAQARRVYAFDLVGAAFGSLGVIFALLALRPATVLACVAALGAVAAALFWLSAGGGHAPWRWRLSRWSLSR